MRSLSLFTLLLSLVSYGNNLTIGSSDTVFCEGDSILLEASSGFYDYEWNTGDEGRLLWVKEGGTYIIQAEDGNADLHYDTIVIHMFDAPELSAYYAPSTGRICRGDSFIVELTEGFEEYWWNTGHTGDRNVLYLQESKTIVVEAIDSNGCEARIEFYLDVDECDSCEDLIEVWPDSISCEGDSINLEAKNGYEVYEWHDGERGRLRWVHETGWYVLTAEDEDGNTCTDSVYIVISDAPVLSAWSSHADWEMCLGDSIVIELSGGFEEYWWSSGHRGDRNVLYPEEDKRIVIEAVDSNGCEARLVIEIEVDSCNTASLEKLHAQQIRVYPNPANDLLRIEYYENDFDKIEILDMQGRVVLTQKLNTGNNSIDVSKLPITMYTIRIGSYYHRFIISR